MRKLLTLAIPMLLGVGLLTAAIHSDPQKDEQSKRLQAGVEATRTTQPAVVGEAAAATTTTTAAPETTTTTAAPAPTTTTTRFIVTTTTARRVTPVTNPRPRPTPTTQAPQPQQQAAAEPTIIDCGTGSANAKANLVNLGGGRYGLNATVINESTKDIELDSLVVTADYKSGKKQFSAPVSGKIVQARPGQAEMTFTIPESEGTESPTNFVISDFRFHTAGLPECTSH
jgi:hypothetical protein